MNTYNLIGIAAWILLLIYLVFICINIRSRHIKNIVVHGKKRSVRTVIIDLIEVVIFFAVGYGLFYAAWLRPVDYTATDEVTVRHEYVPLVLQTDEDQSYYVVVQAANSKTPVKRYTYWADGSKVQVSSHNAVLNYDEAYLPVRAAGYPWSKKTLKKLERSSDRAFAATVSAKYKDTILNGLGMHAGKNADSFTIIRIPNEQLINVKPLQ
ncbi:LVIS_2131 family protein [Lacticaseibacillus hulanensis]|uniref:LVIS_2131 family protein n=1 Tax=Lacticaseibacillus hulanensis TaxID=2493111 RepID=UPI000FDBD157|nr:LVIS_2131 family protein [Lacticaseibacillus hulanensis]